MQPVPTKALTRAVLHHLRRKGQPYTLLKVDEFRTTMCCAACGYATQPAVKSGGAQSTRLRVCRVCGENTHKLCERDRDVQAARNILRLTYLQWHEEPRPEQFRRRHLTAEQLQPPADLQQGLLFQPLQPPLCPVHSHHHHYTHRGLEQPAPPDF